MSADVAVEAEFVYRAAVPRQNGRDIAWVLIGQHGAVELWSFASAEYDPRSDSFAGDYLGGVEVHSRSQLYDFAPESRGGCALLGGADCWHDGSSLAADRLLPRAFAGEDMRSELMDWYTAHLAKAVSS